MFALFRYHVFLSSKVQLCRLEEGKGFYNYNQYTTDDCHNRFLNLNIHYCGNAIKLSAKIIQLDEQAERIIFS